MQNTVNKLMLSASKILIKRSSVPGAVPSLTSLDTGELALNTADKKIFFKNNSNQLATFEESSFTFLSNLSSIVIKTGNNNVTEVYSNIFGGYNNDVSGAGSTVINGENNDISGDFAVIVNGLNNAVNIDGDYGAILGGKNNDLNHQESFIIGSNITSHLSGFTYVNNLSSLGKIYGDGSELVGIVAGDTEATTLVRQQSANWGVGGQPQNLSFNETTKDLSLTYGNTISLSSFGTGADTELRSLSANWESTYNTFKDLSSTFLTTETDSQILSFNESTKDLSISNGNIVSLSALTDLTSVDTGVRALTSNWITEPYANSLYLKLSGGTITGNLSVGGNLYGDGSNLTGIVAGDTEATTLVRTNSGNWESVYTAVQNNSASNWDNASVTSYVNNNFVPLTGGTLTGNLSVLGNLTYIDTTVAVTSAMYIDTSSSETALRITQRGFGDVIRVEDSDNPDLTPFIINSDGLVGIGTSSPNEELTVIGNVSATGSYYGDGSNLTGIVAGDIVATTLVRTNSANWESTYSTVSSLSASWQTTFVASSAYVSSNPTGITGASALTKLIQITQAGYNSITPASDTLYIIVG